MKLIDPSYIEALKEMIVHALPEARKVLEAELEAARAEFEETWGRPAP